MAGKISAEKIKQLQDAFNQFSDKRGLVKTRNIERVLKHMNWTMKNTKDPTRLQEVKDSLSLV